MQIDFKKASKISKVKVYWFDDGPYGGCRIPADWEIHYLDGSQWEKWRLKDYSVIKDSWDQIGFEPVRTKAIRINIQLSKKITTGLYEVIVE